MRSRDEVVERIANDIRQWLAHHPEAADTLEGIRDYWLTEATGPQPKELVLKALVRLRENGVVREVRERRGIPVIYCSANRGQGGQNG